VLASGIRNLLTLNGADLARYGELMREKWNRGD
jgi:hypothetical protein